MVNTKGGKAYKRQKKSSEHAEKKITLPNSNQEIFAQVIKLYGGKNIGVKCSDDVDRMARIPGKLYKKQWMQVNDIVLVLTDETDDKACEIICKYNPAEVHLLKSMKLLNTSSFEGYDDNDDINFIEDEIVDAYYKNELSELTELNNKPKTKLDVLNNDKETFNFDDI